MKFLIFIDTIPVPKARPRFSRFGHARTPDKTRAFELIVATIVRRQMLDYSVKMYDEPVEVIITFLFPRPKSHSRLKRETRWHSVKPDLDNLEKSVCDALNGLLWRDDSLISYKVSSKRYCNEFEEVPGILLRVIPMKEVDGG